jgi:hypothetical protein
VPLLVAGRHDSGTTMRRALCGLGYRWKWPRFVLSRRSPTWLQEKGGLRTIDHLMAMSGRQQRKTAGVLSENIWLPT